jgi:hypothetical protein
VLKSLINGPNGALALPAVVEFLKRECLKKSIAHASAFVLVDWCDVLLLEFANSPEQWTKHGLDVAQALARVLETCMGIAEDGRGERIGASALVSTRRALRAIVTSEGFGEEALGQLVTALTTKASTSTAGNAVLLGVIAGVCSRKPAVKPTFKKHKPAYYTFYVREIIGSRSQLPDHISNAFHDFFDTFPTLEELQKEVISPIEKALLRAPEVVLNDIVSPMVLALPKSMDLSEVLLANLLKPLLSNVKSTNPSIRAGALRTFQALASRSSNETAINKIADEILNPLKQAKVSGVDQKVMHAQMLTALPESVSLSNKIPVGIAPVAFKEPNEPATVAQVTALVKHLTFGLSNGVAFDKTVSDTFIKGMADKRIPIRRLWALRTADLWWNLSPTQLGQPDVLIFCQNSLPKLMEMWQEVIANPVPATQNGLITVGHYVTALLATKVRHSDDAKLAPIYNKSDVISQSFMLKPKPSFLLNPRVYTKLATEDDVDIALRALISVSHWLSEESVSIEAREAWAHAFIFFIVSNTIPGKARSAAKLALMQAYAQAPARISSAIIAGIWSWYKLDAQGDKESAAVAAKTGSTELYAVLGCICLPEDGWARFESNVDADVLRRQSIDLLVLSRSELLPRTSWIDINLRMGVDPGQLTRDRLEECLDSINGIIAVCSSPMSVVTMANIK